MTYSLAEVIAELCSRQSCTRCGGPVRDSTTGERHINGPVAGEAVCGLCANEWLDQWQAKREAEYWQGREALEREFGEARKA